MKKHSHIPTILVLLFLIDSCALPPMHEPVPRMGKETTVSANSSPEKPTAAVRSEPKGKMISLSSKGNQTQTTKEIPSTPAPEWQPQPATQPPQPPVSQSQIFTDYNTGLVFTYQHPWHLISTQGEGSVLGRDGRFQLTTRFVTLTADKEQGSQRGYFYVPENSLTGKVGKNLRSILGIETKQAIRRHPPLMCC